MRTLPPLCLISAAALVILGCGSDSLKPASISNNADLFWDLELNHHAVTLGVASPYNTLQLSAAPRNYLGQPLDGLPAPQYISRDLEKVTVTAEGLLVAVAPTVNPVWVVASVITDNLKHADSVLIKVMDVDPPPVLANMSIHPLPPDSAKQGIRQIGGIDAQVLLSLPPLRMTDVNDVSLNNMNLPVYVRSSDLTIAAPIFAFNGAIPRILMTTSNSELRFQGNRVGTVTFYAGATVFGVTKADTLEYRLGWPVLGTVFIAGTDFGRAPGTFVSPEVTIGAGGMVLWATSSITGLVDTLMITDVTFADADLPNIAAPDLVNPPFPLGDLAVYCDPFSVGPIQDCANAGNFTLGPGSIFSPSGLILALRAFPVTGTYEYRSTLHGTTGRIVVLDES